MLKIQRYTIQEVRLYIHFRNILGQAEKKKKKYRGSWLLPSGHSLKLSSPPSAPKYSNCLKEYSYVPETCIDWTLSRALPVSIGNAAQALGTWQPRAPHGSCHVSTQ